MVLGRGVAGIGVGIIGATISVYVFDLAKPEQLGRLVGIYELVVAIEFCLAIWIGYVCWSAGGDWG